MLVSVEDSASAKLFHEQSSMHEKRTESYSILLRYCSSISYVTVVGAQGLRIGDAETNPVGCCNGQIGSRKRRHAAS